MGGHSISLVPTLLATPGAYSLFNDLLNARPLMWARSLVGRLRPGRLTPEQEGS